MQLFELNTCKVHNDCNVSHLKFIDDETLK